MNKLDQTRKELQRARLDDCAERWGVTIKDRMDFKNHAELYYTFMVLSIVITITVVIIGIANIAEQYYDNHYNADTSSEYSFSQTYLNFVRGCVDKQLTGNLTLTMPKTGKPMYLTCDNNNKFQYTYNNE